MRTVGALMMALAVMMTLFAFMTDTTVYSSGTLIGGVSVGGGSSHNLGLLQKQMMILHTGLAIFIAGTFLYGSEGDRRSNSAGYTVRDERSYEQIDSEIADEIEQEQRRNRIGLIMLGVAVALLTVFLLAR